MTWALFLPPGEIVKPIRAPPRQPAEPPNRDPTAPEPPENPSVPNRRAKHRAKPTEGAHQAATVREAHTKPAYLKRARTTRKPTSREPSCGRPWDAPTATAGNRLVQVAHPKATVTHQHATVPLAQRLKQCSTPGPHRAPPTAAAQTVRGRGPREMGPHHRPKRAIRAPCHRRPDALHDACCAPPSAHARAPPLRRAAAGGPVAQERPRAPARRRSPPPPPARRRRGPRRATFRGDDGASALGPRMSMAARGRASGGRRVVSQRSGGRRKGGAPAGGRDVEAPGRGRFRGVSAAGAGPRATHVPWAAGRRMTLGPSACGWWARRRTGDQPAGSMSGQGVRTRHEAQK